MGAPLLMFTAGLPGSGKTTYATMLAKLGVRHISRDVVRASVGEYSRTVEEHVLKIIKHMTMGMLLLGQRVIVDSTNVTPGDRAEICSWTKTLHLRHGMGVRKVCLYFPCSIQAALERRLGVVPDGAIISMNRRLVVPTAAEGFDAITIVDQTPEALLAFLGVQAHANEGG